MAIFRAAGSKKSPAFSVALSLIASLLVLVGPFTDRSDAYTDFTNFTTAGAITYNDKICNLGDPAMRQSSATAFEISTSDQLWEVTDCVSTSATIYFKLGDNINVSEAVAAPTASPIGYSTSNGIAHSFSGVLDGQNKVVSGISMSTTSYGVGLFALLQNATVSNLVIEGSFVTTTFDEGANQSSGALAIRSRGALLVSSVSNKSTVSGLAAVGGLLGDANDANVVIHSSHNSGAIQAASSRVGGLVGVVDSVVIVSSSNIAAVRGSSYVGGLAGFATTVTILSSSNNAPVNGINFVGGLAGDVSSLIIVSSLNSSSVNGSSSVGGLVGSVTSVAISASMNTGPVSGDLTVVGGLVGWSMNTAISSSMNTGPVSGSGSLGGLIGEAWGLASIDSSSNTGTVSGVTSFVGGLGGSLIKARIQSSSNTGSIFGEMQLGGLIGGSPGNSPIYTAWVVSSFNSGEVRGIGSNPSDAGGLIGKVPSAQVSSSYNLGAVISGVAVGGLVGVVFEDSSFIHSRNQGNVSGHGNFVGGLVGKVDDNESVTDLATLEMAVSQNSGAVSSLGDSVGGLVGHSFNSSISTTFNTGSVSGRESVGGLVGQSRLSAVISNTFNTGEVSGSSRVGGLVGNAFENSEIQTSYNTATVSGVSDLDGLVGTLSGVASVSALYSAQATSYGTVSAQSAMKVARTFVGFDFASIWGFARANNNQGFPILCVLTRVLPCFSDFPRPASSNSALVGLVISEGSLNPVFSQLNMAYSATVSNSITSIRVTPTRADFEAVIAVNGMPVPSGVASSALALSVGDNTINIVVTAADLTTTTHTILVIRAGSGSDAPSSVSSSSQAANYVGPMITIPRSAKVGSEVVFTGTRLGFATRVIAGGIELSLSALVSESMTLRLPGALRPGTYDLLVFSNFGTLTVISGLTVLDPTVPAPEPEAPKKILSVGTFKGYIAIYTKGYEGSKLSAKVAGKWLAVPSLKESWKSKDHSRKVRFTGAGYSIQVKLFIDRTFKRTLTILTR